MILHHHGRFVPSHGLPNETNEVLLNMSERTRKRRLRQEATTFEAARDRVRLARRSSRAPTTLGSATNRLRD